ncbi:serpin family protein [Candidatus Parvarchaeota archaeon]|nr:serpin family protein [Candidatus Parvarchaeota archaeon]
MSLALSMAYRGAGGETERGMASALGFEGIGSGEIDSGSQYLIGQLGGRKDIELEAANSIWLNKDFTLKQDYQKAVEEYYFAKAQSLDFSDPASADTINMWIKDRTRGKIENVISPPIDVYRSFLVNAVYFKGKWAKPFDKTISREREFTSSDGTKKMVMMMKGFDRYDYIENDELQAVRLGYGNGSASMYIVLPRDGASGAQGAENFAESLDGKRWGEITSGMRKKEGTVIMPRFKVEYEKKLNEQLKQMGMEDAFDDTADFSRMAKEPLKISFVLHKTFVESNEEGTEAAAVTVIGMVATSAGPINKPAPFYMEINRPFFYAIQDDKTGEILFMGVMNEIEAQ